MGMELEIFTCFMAAVQLTFLPDDHPKLEYFRILAQVASKSFFLCITCHNVQQIPGAVQMAKSS